ncbi:hypothetical protein D9M68_566690 [compost metagenome]
MLDHIHRRAHQRQHLGTHLARLAGQVQHAQRAALAVGDGDRRAGQDAVRFEIVFRAMDGDGPAFHHRGADGVGARRGLVPGRAGHERNARGALGEIDVTAAVQDQPLRIGQDHEAAAAAGLAAQQGHGGLGHAAQRLIALLGLAQFALRHEFGATHAAHVEAQVGAAPP